MYKVKCLDNKGILTYNFRSYVLLASLPFTTDKSEMRRSKRKVVSVIPWSFLTKPWVNSYKTFSVQIW